MVDLETRTLVLAAVFGLYVAEHALGLPRCLHRVIHPPRLPVLQIYRAYPVDKVATAMPSLPLPTKSEIS